MLKEILILLFIFSCLSISAQVLPNSESSKPSMNKDFWAYELKSANAVDSSKMLLFNIENYLNVLNPDSVQVIQDSLSGLSWVVYPRSDRPSNGYGPLVTLPVNMHRILPNKSSE